MPNAKDSVTSRLPTREHLGVEANRSHGQLVMQTKEGTKVYATMKDADEEEKVLVTDRNKQKGKQHLDPMIETSWSHKEYSTSVEEDISLVENP